MDGTDVLVSTFGPLPAIVPPSQSNVPLTFTAPVPVIVPAVESVTSFKVTPVAALSVPPVLESVAPLKVIPVITSFCRVIVPPLMVVREMIEKLAFDTTSSEPLTLMLNNPLPLNVLLPVMLTAPYTVRAPLPEMVDELARNRAPFTPTVLELFTVRTWPDSTLRFPPLWILMLLTVEFTSMRTVLGPVKGMMTSSLLVGTKLPLQLSGLLQNSVPPPPV